MTAHVIAFPGKRARPLEAHELPEHWSPRLRSHYLHVTCDGFNTHEDAFAYCEAMAAAPPGDMLAAARAAISTLRPRR